jgi:NADPH:quinone reductase-like Zn-dependent oxidoreductase
MAISSSIHAQALSSLPGTMRGAAIEPGGDITSLSLHTVPVPKPKPGEVLIAVQSAGVGVWEARYLPKVTAPTVLGSDGAGTVAALGDGVHDFKVGEAVYGVGGAFYAEYASVPSSQVAKVPHGVTLLEASVLGISGLSALQGIDDVLRMKANETLIIHGAAGSVGSLAVQFAKWRKVRVLATVTDETGAQFVRRMGADVVINGKTQDIVSEAHKFAPNGVDAVLGLAGGDALERCIDALRTDGYGRVAYLYGMEPLPTPRLRIQMTLFSYISDRRELARLNEAVEAAKVQVPVAAQFALADAAQAQARLARGHLQGKIAILIR